MAGAQLTWEQTAGLQQEKQAELQQTKLQLSEIAVEEKRLSRAATALDNRSQAAAHLAALKAPIPTLKRFFSKDAREEFRRTEEQIQHWDQEARKAGVSTEADLKEQRARFERDRARVPALAEKAGFIGRTLERVAKALDGFAQEQERELERRWERINERKRGGYERER
jgi:hypothetical protein